MKAAVRNILIILATMIVFTLMAVPAMAAQDTVKATKVTVQAAAKKKTVALKSIKLSKTSLTLDAGKNTTLKVTYNPTNTTVNKKVTWKSSNTSIATVSSAGKVIGKKNGTATITATVNGKKATCKVTVKAVNNVTVVTPAGGEWVNTTSCYTMLNTLRSKSGAKSLTKDATLEKYAKVRAIELITRFDHTRPNGTKGISMIPGNVYKGENIALGQTSCAQVTTAWNNSDGHRKNMLKTQYTKVGIAAIEYQGTIYWVQMFSS